MNAIEKLKNDVATKEAIILKKVYTVLQNFIHDSNSELVKNENLNGLVLHLNHKLILVKSDLIDSGIDTVKLPVINLYYGGATHTVPVVTGTFEFELMTLIEDVQASLVLNELIKAMGCQS